MTLEHILREYLIKNDTLVQRGPNTGTWSACGLRIVFVRPANAFCMPYIRQSHKHIVLGIQPLQVTHH